MVKDGNAIPTLIKPSQRLKECSECHQWKPAGGGRQSAFHKDRHTTDGFYPKCKECRKRGYEANKDAILDRQSEYRRRKYAADPEAERARVAEWRRKHPRKVRLYYQSHKERWLIYQKKKKLGDAQIAAESEDE
jgi:hypothetical protein